MARPVFGRVAPKGPEIFRPAERAVAGQEFALPRLEAALRQAAPAAMRLTDEELRPGKKVAISSLETVYPFVLYKLGLVSGLPETGILSAETEEAGIIGKKLHEADILFGLVVAGRHGSEIARVAPGLPPSEHEWYARAVQEIRLPRVLKYELVLGCLETAWERYQRRDIALKPATRPLFADQGIADWFKQEEYYTSPEADAAGRKLAAAWARKVSGVEMTTSWEFMPGTAIHRELVQVANLSCGLQLVSRFDSVAKTHQQLDRREAVIRVQVHDLKTGRIGGRDTLQREIYRRQTQMQQLLTEIYALGLNNRNKFIGSNGIHITNVDPWQINAPYLGEFAYREFSQQAGGMRLAPAQMTPEERIDFVHWLAWYGRAMHIFRPELPRQRRSR